jgi:hypothetical protein
MASEYSRRLLAHPSILNWDGECRWGHAFLFARRLEFKAVFIALAGSNLDAKVANLRKVLASVQDKATTPDGVKAAFEQVDRACNTCHETYRLRK